jgi:CheY-like chemotaxis protein
MAKGVDLMVKIKILIVEDESIVALDLKNRLIRLGYFVSGIAVSGEAAIQKAAETCPDLVLMDIRLKGDMDGIEAAKEIQARFGIPIIYLTALVDDDTMQRVDATASDGYILKPFEQSELRATVETALAKASSFKRSL